MTATAESDGPSRLRLVIAADLSKVAKVREWLVGVAASAGLDHGRAFDLQVAVSEAVANAIEHAASDVDIEAWLLPDRLIVDVTNDGTFQPGLCKDDAHRRRGLGLPLMASLADQMHVSRQQRDRTMVSLTFSLDGAQGGNKALADTSAGTILHRLEAETLKLRSMGAQAEVLSEERQREKAEAARQEKVETLAGLLAGAGSLRLFGRVKAWQVLLIGLVAQVAVIGGLDQLGSPSRYLGLPGAWAALVGVLAAVASGPAIGLAVAFGGGLAYFAFLTNFGTQVAWPAIVASILLWMLAAGVAGLAGDWVRRNAEQRESLLSRMLAERESLTDSLEAANVGLQAQNDELAAREEQLLEQAEELACQHEELQAAQEETFRLLDEQSSLFRRLQLTLLDIPQRLPGVDLAHLYRSATEQAEVGGDFYDVLEAKHGRIGLVIGDVSGHGLEAARMANLVKDTVHAFTHHFAAPHLVLRETNRLLVEKNLPGFVTVFLGFLDPDTGLLTYASAGHPGPLVAANGGVTLVRCSGSPLGVFGDARYRDAEIKVQEGSLLLLYTDGITEARRDGHIFGEQRLAAALKRASDRPLETVPSLVFEEILDFSRGRLRDDAAILAVTYQGRSNGKSAPARRPGEMDRA